MTPRPDVSLEDAEQYFAERLRATTWNAADASQKTQALTMASFLISGAFVLYDSAFSIQEDGDVIWDDRITAAVCEEANWLLGHDPDAVPAALFNGISQASAGAVSATFDKAFVCPWICSAARLMVGDLGLFLGDDTEGSAKTTLLAM